jgi:hypothetical protein
MIADEGKEFLSSTRTRRKMLASCPQCTPEEKKWLEDFAALIQRKATVKAD